MGSKHEAYGGVVKSAIIGKSELLPILQLAEDATNRTERFIWRLCGVQQCGDVIMRHAT